MTTNQKNVFFTIIYAFSFISLLMTAGSCFINYQDGVLLLENTTISNDLLFKTYSIGSYNLFAIGIFIVALLLGVIIKLFKDDKIINIITLGMGVVIIIYSLIMLFVVKREIFINDVKIDSTVLTLASTMQALYLQIFIYSCTLVGSGFCLFLNNRKENYEK